MFKKSETDNPQQEHHTMVPRSNPVEQRQEGATIGPSITIKGDLTGDEDLVIQGRVEGKVDLKQNNLTVGKNGRIKANVFGKLICVEGEVEGDLFGQEQVIVRASGQVRGNISAPRVTLEDGARFKGGIDMESQKPAERPRPATPIESRTPATSAASSEHVAKPSPATRTDSAAVRN